jgi:hypothetical protein
MKTFALLFCLFNPEALECDAGATAFEEPRAQRQPYNAAPVYQHRPVLPPRPPSLLTPSDPYANFTPPRDIVCDARHDAQGRGLCDLD